MKKMFYLVCCFVCFLSINCGFYGDDVEIGRGSNLFVQQFSVNFNSNGGSTNPPSQTVNAGSLITLPSPGTRSGFTFAGWFTASSGGTMVGGTGDISWAINSNTTFFAQWNSSSSSAIILTLNSPTTVSITSGVRREVRFTASSAGTYRFESSNRGSLDPTAYTSSTGTSIINNDGAGNLNYRFDRTMTAGQTFTYWSGVHNNIGTGNYTVTVVRLW